MPSNLQIGASATAAAFVMVTILVTRNIKLHTTEENTDGGNVVHEPVPVINAQSDAEAKVAEVDATMERMVVELEQQLKAATDNVANATEIVRTHVAARHDAEAKVAEMEAKVAEMEAKVAEVEAARARLVAELEQQLKAATDGVVKGNKAVRSHTAARHDAEAKVAEMAKVARNLLKLPPSG